MDAQYTATEPFSAWSQLTVDDADWEHAVQALEGAKHSASSGDPGLALEVAMRAAAVGALRTDGGCELTGGVDASLWMAWQAAVRDTTVRELVRAQLRGCELAREAAANRVPITETWLRRLHAEICAPQRTITALTPQGRQEQVPAWGSYKRLANRSCGSDGAPVAFSPVVDTPPEMRRLVAELGSSGFARAHPVLQAAYAHYCLVRIHPFQDGNGRVARALASVYLYRATSLPLLIVADDRGDYLASLWSANRGDRGVFVDFLFRQAVATMRFITRRLTAEGAGCGAADVSGSHRRPLL
jgi:hypothetical protein